MQFGYHWTASKYQMTDSNAFNHNKMGHMATIDEDDKDYEIKRLKMGGRPDTGTETLDWWWV